MALIILIREFQREENQAKLDEIKIEIKNILLTGDNIARTLLF